MLNKKTTLILIFALILSSQTIFSQITKIKRDPNQHVYWFYVKAEIKQSKEHHKPVYIVRRLSKTLNSGPVSKYEFDLWRYLSSGHQLAVGPFIDYNDALRSLEMFDLARKTNEEMEKEIASYSDSIAGNDDFYWYYLKFTVSKRTHSYLLQRGAARVATGDLKYFKQTLWEGLVFEQLAIGPFPSQEQAEESKRLYRIEED
ncbi:MAG: hypothetical protein JXR51_12565 [Bacteroidales bacterium]|nr:hypothetical protein [Bacteroidales bacterium]MBN2758002.1 hypothetical protein [Bacteroidales bacterium]